MVVYSLVAQSCPTLWDPWTVAHQAPLCLGILQARILEWVSMPSSRGSSQPRSPMFQADSLLCEPPGKTKNPGVGSLSFPSLGNLPEPRFYVDSLPAELPGKHSIHNSVCMSILISQFIPPSFPSSLVSLFSVSLTLCFVPNFVDSTCKWYHVILVFLWLHSVWVSRSVHVVANGPVLFFIMVE